jgi:HSP20 family protein
MNIGWRDLSEALRTFDFLNRQAEYVFEDWPGLPFERRPHLPSARAAWPAVNVFETKEAFVYKAEVPGLAEGDVGVHVEDDALILRGERKSPVPEGYTVHLRERGPIAFTRKFPLPGRVDAEGVTAALKDGVLTVTLPKSRDALPRQIAVKPG